MMLYVFHVDVGRMMNFDMSIALSSVENLKDTIEKLHGIPAANIVLLVSGGEMLTQSTQVACYSAGTDTNPIYMFVTGDIIMSTSVCSPNECSDKELVEQVDRCKDLPANYDTVVTRAQLALRLYEMAKDEDSTCERLVHEQHLQQQGWSAVVANMEDLTDEFRSRCRNFCISFERHLQKRNSRLQLLSNFGDDLTKLAKIPILPCLMSLAEEDFHGFDEYLDNDEVFSRSNVQQESVLRVTADNQPAKASSTTEGNAGMATNASTKASEGAKACVDDRNSVSGTSPNKKLKMGNDDDETNEVSKVEVQGEEGSNDNNNTSQVSTTSSNLAARRSQLSLLQWITSKENYKTLQLMSQECFQGLSTFNEGEYETVKNEIQYSIKFCDQTDVKEIKGLGERLCRLEEVKYKVKKMTQDQKELSTGFQQNQNRVINLRDPSILPDLCASHQSQLAVMLQNQLKIREHRRCISKAKDELGSNLHKRLKRIVMLENRMSNLDNRLLFSHRCLKRAERHINIIEQIHQAPSIYVAAVTEVVRRKIFSGEFRQWASKLSDDFDIIHNEEVKRRQLFNTSFEGHFLNILFPGMNDVMPPAFANETPLMFDTHLPNLTKSDIDLLATHLPDLTAQFRLPDMAPVINFFVSRSGEHQKERMLQLLKEQMEVADVNFDSQQNKEKLHSQRVTQLQKEKLAGRSSAVGCEESETDTETDFEKVSTSASAMPSKEEAFEPKDNQSQSGTAVSERLQMITQSTEIERYHFMQSAETLTDENAEEMRSQVGQMRSLLTNLSKLAIDCLRMSRSDLEDLRTTSEAHRCDLQSELSMLMEKCQLLCQQCFAQEQALKDAQLEKEEKIKKISEILNSRDIELSNLRETAAEIDTLRIKCATLGAQLDELREQAKLAQSEKDAAVSAAREEMIREHKTEIESLRCRFKLMTSMERTPSDTSLEKLERPASSNACGIYADASTLTENEMINVQQHETILEQIRATFEIEKKKAVDEVVATERNFWYNKIFPLTPDSVMANVDMLKAMLEEKEKQLDQLREKDLILTKENYQLKTRIEALTNEEGNSWLREKIEYLNRDKSRLEEELNMEKSKRQEMETSCVSVRTNSDNSFKSASSGSYCTNKHIVLESCNKGDIVFVVWSMRHNQFIAVQDSQTLYFVHADSLAALNLRLPSSIDGNDELPMPTPYYAIGRICDKEYCQARKEENRYRVPRGSKFYRIKLLPLSMPTPRPSARRQRLEAFAGSINRSVSQCDSQSDLSVAQCSGQCYCSPTSRQGSVVTVASLLPPLANSAARNLHVDVVDVSAPAAALSSTMPADAKSAEGKIMKQRTSSGTTAVLDDDEDEEPLSQLSDRCRYVSMSEEDELAFGSKQGDIAGSAFADFSGPEITNPQLHTVITEQPTASSPISSQQLQLALAMAISLTADSEMLAAEALPPELTKSHEEETKNPKAGDQMLEAATTAAAEAVSAANAPVTIIPTADTASSTTESTTTLTNISLATSGNIPSSSFCTTSEDSDEYRSLEGKEEDEDEDEGGDENADAEANAGGPNGNNTSKLKLF